MMSRKGYHRTSVKHIYNYVGIRLRTVDDPVPAFPFEIVSPDHIRRLGHALLIERRDKDDVDPTIKEVVQSWMKEHTLPIEFHDPWTRFNDLFDTFNRSTLSNISEIDFERSLKGIPFFRTVPDSLRWSENLSKAKKNRAAIRWVQIHIKKDSSSIWLDALPR